MVGPTHGADGFGLGRGGGWYVRRLERGLGMRILSTLTTEAGPA